MKDLSVGDWGGTDAMKMYRLGLMYTMANALTLGTGLGFSNLIQNDTYETIKSHYNYLSADLDTEEGQEQAEKAMYGQGLISDLGPTVSTVVELGRVLNFYDLDKTSILPLLTSVNKDPQDVEEWEQKYQITRLINLQAARLGFHSGPSFLKGNTYQAILTELGLHVNGDTKDLREKGLKKVRGLVGVKDKKKPSKATSGLDKTQKLFLALERLKSQ